VRKTVSPAQAVEAAGGLPPRVEEALGELVEAAKEGLLALSVGVGLGVLSELTEEEVDEVVGPKGKHDPERLRRGQTSEPDQSPTTEEVIAAEDRDQAELRPDDFTRTMGRHLLALAGGRSPQSSSTSLSAETTSFACNSKTASNARCLAAPSAIGRPSSSTSSGPRIRNSTAARILTSAHRSLQGAHGRVTNRS
jgi:hypothetical protein